MKKALMLGSAAVALAAIAAPVAAFDIDWGGYARFEASGGEKFDNTYATPTVGVTTAANPIIDEDLSFSNTERLTVDVAASNCCIKYGASMRMEDQATADSTNHFKSDIYLSGDWGRVDMGNLDNAKGGTFDTSVLDAGPLAVGNSVTAGGETDLGFTGVAYSGTGIVYTGPAIAGFAPKIAWDGNDVNGSLVGALGPVTLKLAAGDNGTTGAMATYSSGDISLAAFTGEDDDRDSYVGGAIKYSMGAIALSAAVSEAEGNGANFTGVTETDVAIGASYKIATGLNAKASVLTQDNSILGKVTSYKARLQMDF